MTRFYNLAAQPTTTHETATRVVTYLSLKLRNECLVQHLNEGLHIKWAPKGELSLFE